VSAVLQLAADRWIRAVPPRIWIAAGILLLGVLLGYLVMTLNRRLLERLGVSAAVEGTAAERTAGKFGTSTVQLVAKLSGYFVVLLSVFVAVSVAELQFGDLFWSAAAVFLPQLFVAVVILLVGVVVADKVELIVSERLRGIKLPEITVIPAAAKYSVLFVAALIALGQVGVATLALIVLLAAYALALIVFTAVATQTFLASGAAGVYLLLNQPYGIGDEVAIGGQRGIVQEIDLFVTRIETDDEVHIIPNDRVVGEGIVTVHS
jgi:small-conductance mechanosensitive channel